jgi:hypothetical protein
MAQSQQCKEYGSTLPTDLVNAVKEIAQAHGLPLLPSSFVLMAAAGIPSSTLSNPQLLCSDPELQSYLHLKKYQLHPCQAVLEDMQRNKLCQDFTQDLVAPVEVCPLFMLSLLS